MAWQEYIDGYLMQSDNEGDRLTSAAIIGQDGVVWAQSSSFPQFEEEEIEGINNEFEEPRTHGTSGLKFGGIKYMVLQGADGVDIRGKKESSGITIKKTNHGLVIGLYDSPMTGGQCNKIVEWMGKFWNNGKKTKHGLVIGLYDSPMTGGQCNLK